MTFKVLEIIDEYTIKVSPNWAWVTPEGKNLIGDKLRINGYIIPSSYNKTYAKEKLSRLLINREVILKNPQVINESNIKISCRVFIDNIDVSHYFPEYKQMV